MLYALDEKNKKIKPIKGASAICPYCFEKVIAACGEINIHHWRHDNLINCDTWKENETEWHRGWKENYPENWREIIITKFGEKHIADIKTDSGLVLELQNSSISSTTVQIREEFYVNMAWLINATHFNENFSIQSLVKAKLRSLNYKHDYYLNNGNNIEENLEDYFKKLREIEKVIEGKEYELNDTQTKIEKCNIFLDEIDETVRKLVESYINSRVLSEFNSIQIENIRIQNKSIHEIDSKVEILKEKAELINSFPESKVEGFKTYKEIDFNKVSSKSFTKCKVIRKDTLQSFFPETLSIGSEIEFARYSYNKDKYLLIIDLSENLNSVLENISVLEKERESFITEKNLKIQLLKNEVINWLIEKIASEKIELDQLKIDVLNNTLIKNKINSEINNERENLIDASIDFQKKMKTEKKCKEIEIKQKYKGYYTYNWKHRRKTWDYSNRPLFLDFGPHIFQIISENELQKIDIIDFIEKIKNWR